MVSKKELEREVCQKTLSTKTSSAKHTSCHRKANHLVTKPMKKSKARKNNYFCTTCGERFSTHFKLKIHEYLHETDQKLIDGDDPMDVLGRYKQLKGIKEFSCHICGKLFPTKFKLLRHSYIHMDIKPFRCEQCGRRFTRKDHLQVHYRIHTGEKTCFCMVCGQGFSSTTTLHRHIDRLHSVDRKTVVCAECGIEFAFKAQLKRHYDYAHRTNFICELCGNISSSEVALYRHLKKHVLSEPFVCLMCPYTFNSIEEMKNHECCPVIEDPCKVVVRVVINNLVGCEIDPVDELYAVKLQRKFDNRGRKPKPKPENDYFADQYTGIANDNDGSESLALKQNDLTCKFCQKDFPSRAEKIAHESVHIDGYNAAACSICHMKFSSNAKLVRHIRIHTGENPFPCKFCSKAFPREDYLQRHMSNVHATDNETCPYCFKFCPTPKKLEEHLKTHQDSEETNSFFCDTCDTFFSHYSDLKNHMFEMHGDQRHKCNYCSKEFFNHAAKDQHQQNCPDNLMLHDKNRMLLINEAPERYELFSCEFCDTKFSGFEDKLKHLRLIHKPKFYDCDFCPCKFVSSTALRNHRSAVHVKSLKSKRGIAYDGYQSYSKQGTIDLDEAYLNPDKVFQCKECYCSFETSEEFVEHVRQHSFENLSTEQLKCVLCNETFASAEELSGHLQNHDDNMIVEVGVLADDADLALTAV